MEIISGLVEKQYTGNAHHRWLININNNNISFRFKNHHIYNSWKHHLPKSYLKRLKSKDEVSYLFWENSFEYEEIITLDDLKLRKEFEEYVKSKNAYPSIYYVINNIFQIIHPMPTIITLSLKYPLIKKLMENIPGIHLNELIKAQQLWNRIPEIYSKY